MMEPAEIPKRQYLYCLHFAHFVLVLMMHTRTHVFVFCVLDVLEEITTSMTFVCRCCIFTFRVHPDPVPDTTRLTCSATTADHAVSLSDDNITRAAPSRAAAIGGSKSDDLFSLLYYFTS